MCTRISRENQKDSKKSNDMKRGKLLDRKGKTYRNQN